MTDYMASKTTAAVETRLMNRIRQAWSEGRHMVGFPACELGDLITEYRECIVRDILGESTKPVKGSKKRRRR
jgi:hypothetical protein